MLNLPLDLLTTHFIGDFVFQSDWMALNKSKSNAALTFHALVYSLCFLPVYGWRFWLLTFYSHWATDWVTSRVTSRLWFFDADSSKGIDADGWIRVRPNGNRHWFFVAIGADQLIHATTLAAALWLLS